MAGIQSKLNETRLRISQIHILSLLQRARLCSSAIQTAQSIPIQSIDGRSAAYAKSLIEELVDR